MFPTLSRFTDLGLLPLALDGVGVCLERVQPPEKSGRTLEPHRDVEGLHGVSGHRRSRGWPRRRRRSSHSVGRLRIDPHYAGGDGKKDLRRAYRLLGREGLGLDYRNRAALRGVARFKISF